MDTEIYCVLVELGHAQVLRSVIKYVHGKAVSSLNDPSQTAPKARQEGMTNRLEELSAMFLNGSDG